MIRSKMHSILIVFFGGNKSYNFYFFGHYGVARACQFANHGRTIPIIFKSVTDNMSEKDDTAKRFAAHTSAQFLKYLFVEKVLD